MAIQSCQHCQLCMFLNNSNNQYKKIKLRNYQGKKKLEVGKM